MAPYPAWPLVVTVSLARVLLVLIFLYGVMPLLLFTKFPDRGSVGLVGRAVLFLFIVEILAHGLALLRLFEGLLVVALLIGALVWRFYLWRDNFQRQVFLSRASMWMFRWIDRLTGPRRKRWRLEVDLPTLVDRPGIEGMVLLAVLGVAAWMVFAGAFAHAAPAFSDAPVTLEWMKQFSVGNIYGNGVYPKGMYAFLSLLHKLTEQNDLLVMEVTGPLVGLGLVVMMAGYIKWATNSTGAAAVGALVYGTLPKLLPLDITRHVGYNSQEFGVLFTLPAAWFAFAYLTGGKRWHGLTAAAAAGITVFVHPVAALMAVGFMGGATLAALALRLSTWRRIFTLVGMVACAGVIGFLSPLIGLTIMHLRWHELSAEYLLNALASQIFTPPWQMLAVLGVGALAPVVLKKVREPGVWLAWFTVAAGLAMWAGPHLVPVGPLNALSDRTVEAGGMGLAIAAGLAWLALERHLPSLLARPAPRAALLTGLTAAAWLTWPPAIPVPPRISTDEIIIQAMRVDRNLMRGEWELIMGKIGYSLALGSGHHRYPEEFLSFARVGPTRWCWAENGEVTHGDPSVALFLDKHDATYAPLKEWVQRYAPHVPLTQMYASADLEVWLLQYHLSAEEMNKAVWGEDPPACTTVP
jgi:hypothetical protein